MLSKEDLPNDAGGAHDVGRTTTQSMDAADTAERVIGPYHLVRRIEDGMGEVWLVEAVHQTAITAAM